MNINDNMIPDISAEITDVSSLLGKIKRNKKKKEEVNLTLHETRKEILTNLLHDAAGMYESKFKPRKPALDYIYFLTELNEGFYELSVQRKTSPTESEMSYTLFEYLNVRDLDLIEVRYYIRNKMYCFIHYIYEYHVGEKYGRDGSRKRKQSKFDEREAKIKERIYE